MEHHQIVIIGAGFAGLCMGIELRRSGINDFIILEKAEDLGGTWRENTYPGAECDIPSALYSYSFEHNSKWEYKWSGQAQILKYQHDTAEKYGLIANLRFNQEVSEASFDRTSSRWQVTLQNGEQMTASYLITAVGQLHHPNTPKFPDADLFEGDVFHSAKWNHQIDLKGKKVGVIGNAASAVQFVPEIAEEVEHLTVFQRSPNWMLPKMDRPYTKFEQWVSEKIPLVTKLYRLNLWLKGELGLLPAIKGNRVSRWILRKLNQRDMKKHIKDEALRAKLTPDYPIGAKRILFADKYYPALARENVSLEMDGIESFTANGLLSRDGRNHELDVVIYATGFHTNPFLSPMQITGLDEKRLGEHWSNGAHAYLGVTTHGFPNLFMMYGPNTNLGHNSIIIMIEAQAKYILQAIKGMRTQAASALMVDADREAMYNQEIQARLKQLAFSEVAQSWYMDGGNVTNNWAGGTREYMKRLREFDWPAYRLINSDEN